LEAVVRTAHDWLFQHVFVVGNLVQVAAIAVLFGAARLAESRLGAMIAALRGRLPAGKAPPTGWSRRCSRSPCRSSGRPCCG
jgi:hypothetical protein